DQIHLDEVTQAKVLAIVNYADGGLLGGASGILQFEMNLEPDVAYSILRSANSNSDALVAGLKAAGVPPPVAVRLAEIATEMAKLSEAARSDARMKSIIDDAAHLVDEPFFHASDSLFGKVPGMSAEDGVDPKHRLDDALLAAINRHNPNSGDPSGIPLPDSGPKNPSSGPSAGPSILDRTAREFTEFRTRSYASQASPSCRQAVGI